jgi:hypothetical protein
VDLGGVPGFAANTSAPTLGAAVPIAPVDLGGVPGFVANVSAPTLGAAVPVAPVDLGLVPGFAVNVSAPTLGTAVPVLPADVGGVPGLAANISAPTLGTAVPVLPADVGGFVPLPRAAVLATPPPTRNQEPSSGFANSLFRRNRKIAQQLQLQKNIFLRRDSSLPSQNIFMQRNITVNSKKGSD